MAFLGFHSGKVTFSFTTVLFGKSGSGFRAVAVARPLTRCAVSERARATDELQSRQATPVSRNDRRFSRVNFRGGFLFFSPLFGGLRNLPDAERVFREIAADNFQYNDLAARTTRAGRPRPTARNSIPKTRDGPDDLRRRADDYLVHISYAVLQITLFSVVFGVYAQRRRR